MKRVRRTPEQIRALCEQFRQSGMTRREFAREIGVCLGSIQRWLQRFPTPQRPSMPGFIEVVSSPTSMTEPAAPCWMELPGGLVLRFSRPPSAAYIASLAGEFGRAS